jgi:hypothetical protein
MGRICSTYGGKERCIVFWWKGLREGEHLEESGVDWRIILEWIFRKWIGVMNWIDLA